MASFQQIQDQLCFPIKQQCQNHKAILSITNRDAIENNMFLKLKKRPIKSERSDIQI